MASLTPEKPSGKYTLKASKNRGHRNDLTDLDEFVKNGVLRSKHGRDRPDHVSTLMELARDGPLEDFMTACGQLKDSSDNSGNSTYVNLNRAVALNDVNFEDQREALRKLYGAGEKEIGKIFRDIKEMQFNDEDRNWRTKNIREKSRVGNKAERLPVMWNARAVIYPGRTALHMAAANGQVDIVNAICDTPEVDFDSRDVFGYTPLHLACYSRSQNRGDVITTLLKKMDPNVAANENGFYFTALHLAVKSKSKHIVDMLLDWNPSVANSDKVLELSIPNQRFHPLLGVH